MIHTQFYGLIHLSTGLWLTRPEIAVNTSLSPFAVGFFGAIVLKMVFVDLSAPSNLS
ncbi:MAG: hypothetical protein KME16_02405 [Scytolyngbya sp. HA4215-MV1]|nr:hypothetical protein [Scytolyngbya sp. HA4215-MV1]